MSKNKKAPIWYWIISALGLAWNLVGILSFIAHIGITPEMLAEMPAAEQAIYQNAPALADLLFGLAVISGTLGCILLLIRHYLALATLAVSLLAVLIQMTYWLGFSGALEVYGPTAAIMPSAVIAIGIALLFFARKAMQQGWIHAAKHGAKN